MKPKKLYAPKEYIKLLEFCIHTTNLGEKTEAIIRSIYRRYICNENISARQFEVLHNISVMCADVDPLQNILKIKFDGPSEGLPAFALNENGTLRLVPEKPINQLKEKEHVPSINGLHSDDAGSSVRDNSDNSSDNQRGIAISDLPQKTEISGERFEGCTDGSSSGLN